jgi:MraZ protein
MDAKGRVSVPVQFRRSMEEGLDGRRPEIHIIYGDSRRKYLECYTPESFAQIEAQIDELPRGSRTRQTLEYNLISQSYSTEIDADGRLILPQKCRDKARLEGEALFLATGDTFQIWNPDIFETERAAQMQAAIEELPEDEDILALLDRSRVG